MVKTLPRRSSQHKKFVTKPFDVVLQCLREVRQELGNEFDVYNPESAYYRYAGLCDRSIELLRLKLDEYEGFEVTTIHGELSHSIHIDPRHWARQHTVGMVEHPFHSQIYVDPTLDQFLDALVFDDMFPTNFWHFEECGYASSKPLRYIYKDSDNIAFSKLGEWLDENVKVKRKVKGWDNPIQIGLIQFIQYEVWGGVATLIRRITGIERKQKQILSRVTYFDPKGK